MKKQDIICISMTTWEGNYMKTIVHIMNQLAKNHRILFVDYPFTHKDLIASLLGRGDAPVSRLLGFDKRLRQLPSPAQSIFHLTLPPIFPTNWIRHTHKFKDQIFMQSDNIRKTILKAMTEIEMRNPIVINAFNPIIGLPLVDAFDESGLVYYCYDEIREVDWCGKHGGNMEDEFLPLADSVIVTSEALYEAKSKFNSNTHLVKNGVDFHLFNQAHNKFRFNKNRKTIGYIGSVDFRIDYNLLGNVIQLCPGYNFQFIGRIVDHHGYNQLRDLPNVHFTGPKQPHEIPQFMSEFDLGIIPFARNESNKNVYPLKVNEYLAAGLPVVSTDFASLSDFQDYITIVNNEDEFITGLKDELYYDNLALSNERTHIAEQNDWSVRARQLEDILDRKLEYAH